MKTLGLIGVMSWESTVPHYVEINRAVKERLGGLHSAQLVLWSLDFHDVARRMRAGEWGAAVPLFDTGQLHARAAAARALEAS